MLDPKVSDAIHVAQISLERLHILSVLAREGRENLEPSAQKELDFWLVDLFVDAKVKVDEIDVIYSFPPEVVHE